MLLFTSVDSLPGTFTCVISLLHSTIHKDYVFSILLEPPDLLFCPSRLASMDHINNLFALAKDRQKKGRRVKPYVLSPFYDIPLGGQGILLPNSTFCCCCSVAKSCLTLLEKEMATHSSAVAWKIPWTEEPGWLQSMESHSRERLSDFLLLLTNVPLWRRNWQPTPVFLPRESCGWQSLVACCPQGRTESDTTEATQRA